MTPVYLDNNATTRVAPEAVAAMLPFFTEQFGNASSIHAFGAEVGGAVKAARRAVQALIGAEHDHEVIFTSGGTESNTTALRPGLAADPSRTEIITSTVEHPAILNTVAWMEKHEGGEGPPHPRRPRGAARHRRLPRLAVAAHGHRVADVGEQRDRDGFPGRGAGRPRP